jgi:hypothetical protein
MTVKQLRRLFLAVLATNLLWAFFSEPFTFGIGMQWTNDSYELGGGSHPVALAFALTISALYLLLMFSPPPNLAEPLPGLRRRFVTFWIDFILAMMVAAPIVGLLPALTEWRRTGNFQWQFERTVRAPGDEWLLAVVGILTIAVLLFHYAFPLIRRRPSPGACISGYQIVPDNGVRMTLIDAILRTAFGLIAVGMAFLAPFIARDRKKGKFWLDAVFRTRAIILR